MEENLSLARKVARSWASRCRESYEDLEAVAFRGLLNGCRRFDPSRGWTLSTCANAYIHGAIKQWLRDKGHRFKLPMRWREQWGRLAYELAIGTPLPAAAAAVGMSEEDVQAMSAAMATPAALNEALDGRHDDQEPELDALAPVDRLLAQALERIRAQDRRLLIEWDRNTAHRTIPYQSLTALVRCAAMLRQGMRLEAYRQIELRAVQQGQATAPPAQPAKPAAPRKRQRSVAELREATVQLGLLTEADLGG